MAVKVGSARIDERGRASGGKAGDQTGKEVCIENWYKHSLGWYVIRAKSATVREKIAQDMEWACVNPNIGYDQGQNMTLWTVASKVGFNCKKVKTPCETDCARLTRVCVKYAGVNVPDYYTGNEVQVLKGTGAFQILTAAKYCNSSDYLLRGDILVTRTKGHTVVVLTNGAKAVAPKPTPTPAPKPTPAPATKVKFTYQVRAGGKKYSTGKRGKAITDIAIKVNKGALKYRVHVKGGKWLPYVTGYSWKNAVNGYAGNGKPIDAVQVILTGVNAVATYRVSPINKNFYPYQKNAQTKNGQDGYAGVFGVLIDRFEIK